MIGMRSADKVVPEVVWRGGWGVKRAFLMACFEGDGGPVCRRDGFTDPLLDVQRASRS